MISTRCTQTIWRRGLLRPALLLGLAVSIGCGDAGYRVAPVSGVVRLNGNPVAGARINTQPKSSGDNGDPGPGSFAVTDEEGRYQLELVNPAKPGAVVGEHVVRISKTKMNYQPGREDMPSSVVQMLPASAGDGTLTLSVPREGLEQADFDLSAR